ncbi:sin-like protein conserved region domain-containing protein [Trichoderma breve]|uniref:Sin-like protein conserved region domain-containing protein n=1 Tax=Trichoderma breve TaxID=2034170 RepID=A0A9W9B7N5_9HYPO|nr:sin-like protein conserved region domain-containing protein [Trichoderma breve]KAJ4854836.1 sin-like protein conserved region domain-containing protein [Trichoderma breve]
MSNIDPDLMDIVNDNPKLDHDDNNDEDDPITASYQVFLNPALPLGRRLLVLQHPNRTDSTPRPPPTELRLKEHSGMVEIDMPMDNTTAYDREKGLRWGRTLQNSMAVKNGGSHGLAGGFGVGAVQQRAPRKKGDVEEDENLDWNDAVRQGKVLSTQTLGGQYPDTDEVQYMVGVFQGKDLHLTPVSNLIHLRPQLHHLDAATAQERQSSAAASKDGAAPAAPTARAIHMTIKTTAEGADGVSTETMADRLRSVQTEPWRKMRYTDENEETAWEVYNDSLFLRPRPDPAGEQGAPAADADRDLEELVPTLGNKWDDTQFLESISGIKKPDPVPELPVEKKPEPVAAVAVAPAEEPRQPPRATRPRAGAAAALAARRGGRARGA